jgi:ATP-dependent Clp protease ATP-binding subunit ClpA
MISGELEASLHTAFLSARLQRHEFITVEHLFLALLENPSAIKVLQACSANISDIKGPLAEFIRENTPQVRSGVDVNPQPTLGFQRVIQNAITDAQDKRRGKKEALGSDALLALYGEKDSHAVYFLCQQHIARPDMINYISHGIRKNCTTVASTQRDPNVTDEQMNPKNQDFKMPPSSRTQRQEDLKRLADHLATLDEANIKALMTLLSVRQST